MNPADLKYSKEHEWVRIESEGVAIIGITEYATESLGDVVFLDLPDVEAELTQSEKLGEVESVKAVSDIYSPISGRVLERNEQAIEKPEMVNDGPYESGWLLKMTVSNMSDLDSLMTAAEYDSFLSSQEH